MTDNFRDDVEGNPGFELLNDKSITEIIDINVVDFGDFKVAVEAISDISN